MSYVPGTDQVLLRRSRLTLITAAAAITFVCHAVGETDAIWLRVDGVPTPLSLDEAQFKALPRTTLTTGGKEYQGVSLMDLLNKSNQPLGDKLHGKDLNQYVLVKAGDGYAVVIALPELDNTVFLVADTVDGKPLPDGEGKLRLIIDTPRKGRWVKDVRSISIQRATA